MNHARRRLPMLALLVWFTGAVWAQTTGTVAGKVTDEAGGALPGVVVEAKGPALQGSRATTTGADGRYRLTLLPPGQYTVSFSLTSYRPESKSSVIVNLDKDSTLDSALRREVREEVTVVADIPAVDTTSTSLGTNLSSLVIQTLPTTRNYSGIVQIVPGTSSDANPENKDQTSITVYGSAGNEN